MEKNELETEPENIMEEKLENETENKSEDEVKEFSDSQKKLNELALKPLSDLPGVGPVTQKKLNTAGIVSVFDIITRSPRDLADITGMETDGAEKLHAKVRAMINDAGILQSGWRSGVEILKERKTREKIKIGVPELDELFGGGIETQAITEVYGEFGSGKTQFCHHMAVQVQLPKEKGGLDGNILIIDTEHTFRPERIETIAQEKEMDGEQALSRIEVARAYSTGHQMELLQSLSDKLRGGNVKLLIVDSAVGLFRAEYLGRGTLSERQQRINHFVHLLSMIAETYNIACIITNQVQSNPGQMFGDATKPIGGNIVGHTSTYRIYFRKSGKKRVAKMVDSPHLPENEVKFILSEQGLSADK